MNLGKSPTPLSRTAGRQIEQKAFFDVDFPVRHSPGVKEADTHIW
jgi:hypothetical protein